MQVAYLPFLKQSFQKKLMLYSQPVHFSLEVLFSGFLIPPPTLG